MNPDMALKRVSRTLAYATALTPQNLDCYRHPYPYRTPAERNLMLTSIDLSMSIVRAAAAALVAMQRRGVRVVLRLGPAGQPEFALIRQGGPIPPNPPHHKGLGAGERPALVSTMPADTGRSLPYHAHSLPLRHVQMTASADTNPVMQPSKVSHRDLPRACRFICLQ